MEGKSLQLLAALRRAQSITQTGRELCGSDIITCEAHGEQFCPDCGYSFTEINHEARHEARRRKAIKPPNTALGDGLLMSGTEVRMPDTTGENNPPNHLDGQIGGVLIEEDEETDFAGEQCYVIQYGKQNAYMITYSVESVHEEWQVKTNGQYVSASKYMKLLSGDESDEED
ncbi:hypothetical protein R1sor_009559 [Riccia sorocarpa]|uniref:C2H2-type domain-containing protein n=1 Tax=Riccia sorocarpa TaxID=122646 RepID=A0ABD3HVP7_9MARC